MSDKDEAAEPIDSEALIDGAQLLRDVLRALPAGDDSPTDAAVRRRLEGAIAAAELAAGKSPPRVADEPLQE